MPGKGRSFGMIQRQGAGRALESDGFPGTDRSSNLQCPAIGNRECTRPGDIGSNVEAAGLDVHGAGIRYAQAAAAGNARRAGGVDGAGVDQNICPGGERAGAGQIQTPPNSLSNVAFAVTTSPVILPKFSIVTVPADVVIASIAAVLPLSVAEVVMVISPPSPPIAAIP